MASSPIPGILYACSRITDPSLSKETFLKWYIKEHIPEVMATSGVTAALFYKNIDPDAERPYLAVYELPDLAFLEEEAFKTMNVHSTLLPGSGLCYDSIDFDVRAYKRVQEFSPKGAKIGAGNCVMTAAIEPAKDVTPEDFDGFYRDEHLAAMNEQIPSFVRSLRYKLAAADLPTEEETANAAKTPTWFALHEFEVEDPRKGVPLEELERSAQTAWAARVLKDVKVKDIGFWEVLGRWGGAAKN